ncbi:DNRLRE domain-containing protein [Nonomuraea phyllanthi]|uniref:LamG-like jellyroll fold domain-containing protein n=1 Tax=Nonomuraea phyllanthi TaxID=2219224 RepID=UPI00129342FE|nr:LamG-like jellyroll fold domain-containing protein [Nonomuraea phyllanthi]QFY11590.1 DNRLRE domain-containing protein [Nonomuraea phyllanthi]
MNTQRPASGLSTRTRRRAALIAALALPISLMAAPAIAQGPTPSPTPTTSSADTSTPTGAALAQAKKDNKRVEIEALRSETSTYYANPDGKTLHAELHSTPIRVKKNNAWQQIDPTLIEQDGVLRPKAITADLALSLGGDTTALTYTGDKGKGTISTPHTLPKPVVKGNTATYPDAYAPGTDLVITTTPTGFRHEIVLRQRPAKNQELRIPLSLPKGLKLGKGSDKTPGVLDSKGEEIADLATAPMLDATEVREPATGRMSAAKASLDGDGTLVLTPDAGFLADPAVTYPVTLVAPLEDWTGTGIAGDTFVSHSYPNSSSNKSLNRIIVGQSNSGTVTWRGYIRFNIHDTPLMGGTVSNADLRLFNYDTNDCSDADTPGIVVRRVTTAWDIDTMTVSNQPTVTPDGQYGNRGAYGIDCPEGEGELYYSIEQITQDWMDGEADHGVQLASASETVPTNWRWYRSDEYGGYDTYPFTPRGPVLFVEYEPGTITQQVVVPIAYTGPDQDEPLTYAEAIAQRLETDSSLPTPPSISLDQAQQIGEQTTDTYEVPPDDLLPLPEEEPEANDVTPPTVIETTPTGGAVNIGTAATAQAVFSEPVSGTTLTVKDAAGTSVSGTLESAGENRVAIFTPNQALEPQTTYTVEVTGSRDAAGNTLAAPYAWSFTTGADTPPPAQGLVAAYGMNEGSGTSVADSSGQNNTGVATDTTWGNGKYGKALSFDGSSSWVTVQDAASLRLTAGMTLSAWVNPATVSAWSPIVGKELNGDAVSSTLYASNGSAPSGWVQTDPVTSWTVSGTSPLPVNAWSHVALTYDGAALRLYVNGQQAAQTALSGSLYDDGSPLRIGGNAAWSEYFSGLIDEVRVYNRAQSATEVQTDMTTPIGGTAPADTQAPTAPGSLTATGGPGSAQLTWTASTDNVGVDGYTIHRSTTPGFTPSAANQVGSSPTTTFTDAGLAAGTYYYRVRAADAAGNLSPSSNEVSATVTAQPTIPGLVAAYGMEEGTGTTVGDSSGQNNTGAATDTTWTATGKHGKALSFNGISSWVTVPHAASLRLTTALTLSAWVRPATQDSLWRSVLMKEHAEGGGYGLYASTERSGPGGWLQTTQEAAGIASSTALPLNQWSHLAFTYDGAAASVYVNGTLVGQVPMAGEVVDDGGALRIGGNAFWDEFYSGLIDEVRVYNRVQTATEIQTDMNTPVGAAPAGVAASQRRMETAADASPTIDKLTVEDAYAVDRITVTSDLTPQLTTWLAAGRDGEAKVEVEIIRKPTKSVKAGKVTFDKRLIWTGHTTAKPGDTQASLQVPRGKLRDGEKVRWRARVTTNATGAWSDWQILAVKLPQPTKGTPKAEHQQTAVAETVPKNFPYNRVTWESCWADSLAGQFRDRGDGDLWHIGHSSNVYNWCAYMKMRWPIYELTFNPRTGRVVDEKYVGQLKTRFSTRLYTHAGSKKNSNNEEFDRSTGLHGRDMLFRWRVDQIKWVGSNTSYYNAMTLRVGIAVSDKCQITAGPGIGGDSAGKEQSWRTWETNAEAEWTIHSPKNLGEGRHALSSCLIQPHAIYTSPLTTLTPTGTFADQFPVQSPVVRCDTSPLIIKYTGGCVLIDVNPVLVFDATVKNRIRESAKHVWDAYFHADTWTQPKISEPKRIPGRSPNGKLHRIIEGAVPGLEDPDEAPSGTINANRRKSIGECEKLWPTVNPDADGLDCDEYPFASTREGSQAANGHYSIRYIAFSDNRSSGSDLGVFYERQRRLAGDAFWVYPKPLAGDQNTAPTRP